MRTIAVIPARFESKRLPGKPLASIGDKPLIQHVFERASLAKGVDDVLVATDDERILSAVESAGGRAVMTSSTHQSGSDRVAEAVSSIDCDLVVNVQGDEPMIAPEAIDEAVSLARSSEGAITTLSSAIHDRDEVLDPNTVKVVTDRRGFALYFSRAPIPPPGPGPLEAGLHWKHIGLYVYPKDVLLELTRLAPTPLELAERLEQLRALENGISIRVATVDAAPAGIDTLDSYQAFVRRWTERRSRE